MAGLLERHPWGNHYLDRDWERFWGTLKFRGRASAPNLGSNHRSLQAVHDEKCTWSSIACILQSVKVLDNEVERVRQNLCSRCDKRLMMEVPERKNGDQNPSVTL